MTALQTIDQGTPPAGTDGDTVRTAFTKVNSNITVLASQASLTSAAPITGAQALTAAAHLGQRVNIILSEPGVITLPPASTCVADGVMLLRNMGTAVATLTKYIGSNDTVALSQLNPGETALLDTDGAHAWNVLMRGRSASDNEVVNGNSVVTGNETLGGTLAVTGNTTLGGTLSVIGAVTVPEATQSANPATLAQVQASTGSAGSLMFRNKLFNTNFLINQRSYVNGTATVAANQYTLDRWRVVVPGQSVTVTAQGNRAYATAPAGGLEQLIENMCIEGGDYVLSWGGTATATVNGAAVAKGGTFNLPAGVAATVRFSGGTVITPQLEPGTIPTVPEYRPYSVEFDLCRRYWEAASIFLGGYAVGGFLTQSGTMYPKRISPLMTVVSSGAGGNFAASGTITPLTNSTFYVAHQLNNTPGYSFVTDAWTADAEMH